MMSKIGACWLAIFSCLCFACSWVDDDLSDCPSGFWLKLSYRYNILNVDAAFTQLKNASIFIFDETGNYIETRHVDSLILHQNNCQVRLESLSPGKYNFLVWSGLTDSCYECSASGVRLLCDASGTSSKQLPALFHGRLEGVEVPEEYTVREVPLIKLTHRFTCVLQGQNPTPFADDEFLLEIRAFNGMIDHRSLPLDSVETCYLPFYQTVADLSGLQVVHSELNTLRLLENDDTRLILTHRSTGQRVLDIPLTKYLLLSREAYSGMTPQEYLDRQDQYTLIFFLDATEDKLKPYICPLMKVNNWMVRINDVDLES